MALSSCAAGGILVSAAHASALAKGDAIEVVESDVCIDVACLICPKTVSLGLTEGVMGVVRSNRLYITALEGRYVRAGQGHAGFGNEPHP